MKYKLFSVLFLLLCLIPVAGLLIWGPAQASANETLSPAPTLTEEDGSLNLDVLDEFSDYFSDRFALRQEMITGWREAVAAVFHESDEEDVVLGKDGWLFYAETLDDYEGVNLLTDRQIYAAAKTLALMQEYCEGQGAQFLFTVAPNKNSLYPEYVPSRYPAAQTAGNRERLAEALAAQRVSYLDLYALLDAEDAVLYRKTDSHWNEAGAALAGDAILEALGVDSEPFYGSAATATEAALGDLYQMLYPTGTALDEDIAYDRAFTFSYASPIRSVEDLRITTVNESASGGSLLMFRDSFGNALHPYVAEGFQNAVFSRSNPYDLTMIASTGADTVVIELVERNLDWLCSRAPVFEAPARTLEETPALSETLEFTASLEESGPEGCVKLTGSISCPELDADSPIYLLLGDTVYEATPSGEGELPFTAYVPANAAAGSVTLIVRVDGQLVKSAPIDIQA